MGGGPYPGRPSALSASAFWNAGARGTTTWTDVDGHSWYYKTFECGMENNPVSMTELLRHPLWLMTDHRATTGKHRIYWNSMQITQVRIFTYAPSFPGWAGDIMQQNGKAVPGWMSQLVTNDWVTSFAGKKTYLTNT